MRYRDGGHLDLFISHRGDFRDFDDIRLSKYPGIIHEEKLCAILF